MSTLTLGADLPSVGPSSHEQADLLDQAFLVAKYAAGSCGTTHVQVKEAVDACQGVGYELECFVLVVALNLCSYPAIHRFQHHPLLKTVPGLDSGCWADQANFEVDGLEEDHEVADHYNRAHRW